MLPNLPKGFKPMLAASLEEADYHKLQFPLLAQPKYDGVRVIIDRDGVAFTRSLKPIPNIHIQNFFKKNRHYFQETEGELCADTFKKTTEIVMSQTGTFSNLSYSIFDDIETCDYSAKHRLKEVDFITSHLGMIRVEPSPCYQVVCLTNMEAQFQGFLEQGYEGMMLRHPDRLYKFGRSSTHPNQQHLMKMKTFHDAEATILGINEKLKNNNPATINALGATERASKAEGKVGTGTLGSFAVRAISGDYEGVEFKVGSGFTEEERKFMYSDNHIGKTITFKYQKEGGSAKPRFPIFKGFRKD